MFVRVFVAVCWMSVAVAASTSAQQPFFFVMTTPEARASESHTEALALFAGQRLDPLTGVATRFGRLALVGLEDSRFVREDSRHVRQTELLADLSRPSATFHVAVGGGLRRESNGVNVLLTRLVIEKAAPRSRMIANVVLERPLSGDRDEMDVMTSLGVSRSLSRLVSIGLEALGEDLEGLWNPAEAEGGARVFVGPSLDLGSRAHTWAFHMTAGADMRATQSGRSSEALRALGRPGLVARVFAIRTF
jgi:hypothetical protein